MFTCCCRKRWIQIMHIQMCKNPLQPNNSHYWLGRWHCDSVCHRWTKHIHNPSRTCASPSGCDWVHIGPLIYGLPPISADSDPAGFHNNKGQHSKRLFQHAWSIANGKCKQNHKVSVATFYQQEESITSPQVWRQINSECTKAAFLRWGAATCIHYGCLLRKKLY